MAELRRWICVCLGLAALAGLHARPADAQVGTAFTYQGRLTDTGAPANGPYDFQFILYDAAVGGSQQGPVVTRGDVAVSAGLFTVSLDFGTVFTGNRRFLEMAVRPGASTGTYTPLAGRQELTPGPHVLYSTMNPWGGLIGVPAGFADNIDNDSGGDITQVTAGTGLTGGGTTGAVTVSASFGGSGSATTLSRSDHNHFGAIWSGALAGGNYGLTVQNTDYGILGSSTGTVPGGYGVRGELASSSGSAVSGYAYSTSGFARGIEGMSFAASGYGVLGNGNYIGVAGFGNGPNTIGVTGNNIGNSGVGVQGQTAGTTGSSAGIYGSATANVTTGATGVWGVQGPAAASYAGYFSGRTHVNGTLSKAAGSFKIDHPLDPENKYLYHSFVESPDMMNVYNGNAVLDAEGQAEVTLPEWFEALNKEFRYQLTAIGAPGPGLHVAREIKDNRFRIAGGSPGLKVSWQVTGIRHDAYAEKNRVPVEETKPEHERGVYLQPEAHGQPRERGLDFRRQPREIALPPPDTARPR